MEVGTQTDIMTNNKVIVLNAQDKKKKHKKRMKSIPSIANAEPDIEQKWRIYKNIIEPNMLKNVEIQDDIVNRINEIFGEKLTPIQEALETFQKNKGKAITSRLYTDEEAENIRRLQNIKRFNTGVGGVRPSTISGSLAGDIEMYRSGRNRPYRPIGKRELAGLGSNELREGRTRGETFNSRIGQLMGGTVGASSRYELGSSDVRSLASTRGRYVDDDFTKMMNEELKRGRRRPVDDDFTKMMNEELKRGRTGRRPVDDDFTKMMNEELKRSRAGATISRFGKALGQSQIEKKSRKNIEKSWRLYEASQKAKRAGEMERLL